MPVNNFSVMSGRSLGHVTLMPRTTSVPPCHGGSTPNLDLIGQVVLEEKMFKHCGQTTDGLHRQLTDCTDDGRTAWVISSPDEPLAMLYPLFQLYLVKNVCDSGQTD